jgi:hypothetical protein
MVLIQIRESLVQLVLDLQIAGIAEAGRALPQAGARAFGPVPPSPVVSKLDALLF